MLMELMFIAWCCRPWRHFLDRVFRDGAHCGTIAQGKQTGHDHGVTGLHAAGELHTVRAADPKLHACAHHFAAFHQQHFLALYIGDQCFGRNDQRVVQLLQTHIHFGEGTGEEAAVLVAAARSDFHRARGGVHAGVHGIHFSGVGARIAFHGEVDHGARFHDAAVALGHGELHFHGIGLLEFRDQDVAAHVPAFTDGAQADLPAERCADRALGDLRAEVVGIGLQRRKLRLRCIVLFLTDAAYGEQLLLADFIIRAQLQVGFGLAQLGLQFVVVDAHEHLPRAHVAAFLEPDHRYASGEFAHQVHLLVGEQGPRCGDGIVQGLRLQHMYLHGHGRYGAATLRWSVLHCFRKPRKDRSSSRLTGVHPSG
jgi:hypothetical protein